MYMLNLRVVGMDVAEIQIDSTSDWTRRTTSAATARHLVGNKRPNKAHVANTACLTSKLLPQPVTEPGCNLRLDSHADKLCEPVRASSLVAQLFRFSHVALAQEKHFPRVLMMAPHQNQVEGPDTEVQSSRNFATTRDL